MVSPLLGAEGNLEFLAHRAQVVPEGRGTPAVDVEAVVAEATRP
jgi:hypothetical protein